MEIDKHDIDEEAKAKVAEQEKEIKDSKDAVKEDAKGLFASLQIFLKNLLDFREDTDRDATIAAIKADIPFRGATSWILVCSIFVASIGLNANSTAVVIGAMLISPLMGPILGIGFSIAVNDIDTLKRSMINLAVMIILSLLTAFLFFYFFPLSEDTSELLGRIRPDIRDVLIAFFGGLALIIARTKKGTIASVIFGVAIATALMPPLCTAGYGLAIGNFNYFGGAMYLFSINTIFIALATFLVLKLLKFPMQRYANSKRRRLVSRVATLVAIVVMIPAVWTFINVLEESRYQRDYKNFMKNEIEANNDLWLQRDRLDMVNRKITLYFNGAISKATDSDLRNELKDYENISTFDLIINSNESRSADRIIDLYDRAVIDIEAQDSTITVLRKEIEELQLNIKSLNDQLENKNIDNDHIVFTGLARDAKIRYKELEYFGLAQRLESSDFIKVDTTTVVSLRWNSSLSESLKVIEENKLRDWLKELLKTEKIIINRQ